MDRLGLLCRNIYENNKMTQRELAAAMDISLGTCNHLVKEGLDQELFSFDPVDGSYSLLKGGVDLLRKLPDGQRRDPRGGIRVQICTADLRDAEGTS